MSLSTHAVSLLALSLLLPASPVTAKDMAPLAAAQSSDLPESNPFAHPSSLPFGAPPFDEIKDGDFQAAIDSAMRQHDAEIAAIAGNSQPPTFDNTIAAMERAGQTLAVVSAIFDNLVSANTNTQLDKVNAIEAPRLQAHFDKIRLNSRLFGRVRALYETRSQLGLDKKQNFLLDRVYHDFVRAGASLAPKDQQKLLRINEKITRLSTAYRNRLMAASNAAAVIVDDKTQLDGLSDSDIAQAAEAAKARKLPGRYLLVLSNTTQQPLLATLKNRALRQKLLEASESRGSLPGRHDLRDMIITLAQLRAERARLSGFPSYVAFKLDEQMAKTPGAARKLLAAIVPTATAMARHEANEIQQVIDAEDGHFALTAADWPFYAAKVQKMKYGVDDAETRQYFELNRVLIDGVFFAANQLYGLTFKERTDIPVYHPDVKVFEVFDVDGSHLALFYADYFARPNKNGGAWCSTFNRAGGLFGTRPIIVNVANLTKPAVGEPALLSYDDVITLFHEFGHALHEMMSIQYYPSENGFRVPTDVIEFPSQFNEHWALYPSVLANYAKHNRTGAPMPQELIEKIKQARNYGTGYATTEIVSAALLDLEWHSLPAKATKQQITAFEAEALKKNGVDLPEVPPRYKTAYFQHIWAGGYEGNYYSYLWGEILDDDAFEWFTAHGGLTRENGQRFRDMMLAPGYSADPMTLYRAFRGGEPTADALRRQRGLED
ncbi:M3 family metallopeptidase [Telmatospirillum sp.]|uniref:M3 family metallopeptidase n=1 Tax=Telmatospirillum sp. TaxID=2079197 RepID=UPI00283B68AD|nr:M3 family metallopeptidase [Telmatospirillum sp.]MDR3436243.1 M3 family metallopeptidase [Telmatospirillum sp.]